MKKVVLFLGFILLVTCFFVTPPAFSWGKHKWTVTVECLPQGQGNTTTVTLCGKKDEVIGIAKYKAIQKKYKFTPCSKVVVISAEKGERCD